MSRWLTCDWCGGRMILTSYSIEFDGRLWEEVEDDPDDTGSPFSTADLKDEKLVRQLELWLCPRCGNSKERRW